MSKRHNLYIGRAGHFAVMSEFLLLGWNVAIPEVDVGDDIFVVRDQDAQLVRVQVKTARGKLVTLRNGQEQVEAQFSVKWGQLADARTPDITYAVLVRLGSEWLKCMIVPREDFYNRYLAHKPEALLFEADKVLVLNLIFVLNKQKQINDVRLLGESVFTFYNNFAAFPLIAH